MNKQKQIEHYEEKIRLLKEEIESEKNKVKRIRVGDYYFETNTHDFNKCLKDITIPKGAELWTSEDCINLHNDKNLRKKLNLEDCWFFIKQEFKFNEEKGYVAGFLADSAWADLDCYWGPDGSYPGLGVRWKFKARRSK